MADFTINYATGSTLYVRTQKLSDDTMTNITLTDVGDGTYTANMPSGTAKDQYRIEVWKQAGASPDPGGADTMLTGGETRVWSGSNWDFNLASGPYANVSMRFGNLRG